MSLGVAPVFINCSSEELRTSIAAYIRAVGAMEARWAARSRTRRDKMIHEHAARQLAGLARQIGEAKLIREKSTGLQL